MTIFTTAAELLASGPQTLTDLTDHALRAGATKAKAPEMSVRQSLHHRAVQLPDGRYANPVQLLEGRVLTTRGSHPRASYDLAPFQQAARWSPLRLAGGGRLTCGRYDDRLLGPAEWAPDDTPYSLRLTDGIVHVEQLALDELEGHDELVALIGPLKAHGWRRGTAGLAEDLATRLWGHLAADASLLTRAGLPLSECFPQLGDAISKEQASKVQYEDFWQPTLQLSLYLADLAHTEAAEHGEPTELWLNGFVARKLRELDEDYLAPVVKLRAL